MGILEQLGFSRKKARPVGQSLEKGKDVDPRAQQKNIAVKVLIFLAMAVIAWLAFPRDVLFEYTVQVGDVWRQDTEFAPFSFAIYKDPDTLQAEREEVRRTTAPFFEEIPDASEVMAEKRDSVRAELEDVFDRYASYQFNMLRGRLEPATRDSARYMEQRENAQLQLSSSQWNLLARDYAVRLPGLVRETREPPEGPPIYEDVLEEAFQLGIELNESGVLDVPKDSIDAEEIIVRNVEERTQHPPMELDEVIGLEEAYGRVVDHFEELYDDRPEVAGLADPFFRAVFEPSLQYMREETEQEIQARQARISPTRGRVEQGEVIVREGERITAEIRQKLVSLDQAQTARDGPALTWRRSAGQMLLVLGVLFIFFMYLYLVRPRLFRDNRKILLMALLFAGVIGLFAFAVRVSMIGMYAVPVAVASVLLTVMFDSRVGLFGTLTLALLGGLLLGFDFEYTLATVVAGVVAVFSVRDIKNRGQFFVSASLVFLAYVAILVATALLYGTPAELLWPDLVRVGANSFLLVLAYPLLWIFERSFDITTDLTLLELSDTNRPLLKELSMRAPGTFNHTLQVANLAEAGANAIDANALLTRVGALYHDIGKMLKPEYFVENQRTGVNPHDQLKPKLSALIIASHVKEGLEMGRQYNLPKVVIDFIPTHHGTARIEYFYRKAIEQRSKSEPEVMESEFRYPGPRPFSKETGIMMLADSVEAASRSLSDPSHKRLETLIDMIFQARIDDGQLDETDLTFRDLNKIKETFMSILLGVYHVRVRYPGQEETDRQVEASKEERRKLPAPSETQPVISITRAGFPIPDEELPEILESGMLQQPSEPITWAYQPPVASPRWVEPDEGGEKPSSGDGVDGGAFEGASDEDRPGVPS